MIIEQRSAAAALSLAGRWFLESGIQETNGGVARYYHTDVRRNARISTEISGYTLSALLYLWERRGDPGYLAAARRTALFLCGEAWDAALDLFPFEHAEDGSAPALAYFFDCGIIARALLWMWRATGEERWLQAAERCGDAMRRDFCRDGVIHPILSLPSKDPLPHEEQWSRQPGCYQLKSALAWWELFEATGRTDFREWYRRAAETALQSSPSFLPAATRQATMDRLHAYSYFLEAILPLASDLPFATALADGIERVSGFLRAIRPEFERSDVNAQLLRVRLHAERLAGIPLREAEAAEEAAAIASYQEWTADDTRLRGGYWFGRRGGELTPFANPVSTAFCLQALDQWEERRTAGHVIELDRQRLI